MLTVLILSLFLSAVSSQFLPSEVDTSYGKVQYVSHTVLIFEHHNYFAGKWGGDYSTERNGTERNGMMD